MTPELEAEMAGARDNTLKLFPSTAAHLELPAPSADKFANLPPSAAESFHEVRFQSNTLVPALFLQRVQC